MDTDAEIKLASDALSRLKDQIENMINFPLESDPPRTYGLLQHPQRM